MRWFRVFALWVKTLIRRDPADSELQSEFEDYLAQETAANLRSGMSLEEARYAARRALGSAALYEEQCRDERGTSWLDNFVRDARYCLPRARTQPAVHRRRRDHARAWYRR